MASMGVATLISLNFFLYQSFIIGALFFLLAFQSYDTFRRTRHFSDGDRDDSSAIFWEMRRRRCRRDGKRKPSSCWKRSAVRQNRG